MQLQRNYLNFYCSVQGKKGGINIEEISAIRAAEEYAEAEQLACGTIVVIEHVGDFCVRKVGDNYVACSQ